MGRQTAPFIDPAQEGTVEQWPWPPLGEVKEGPPARISGGDRRQFNEVLEAHAEPPLSGEDIYTFVGLDFGTSSTKMVVRFPYEPGETSIAIPAPPAIRSGNHPYLWGTVVWKRDGVYLPWPEAGASALYRLKQGLLAPSDDEHRSTDANVVAYLAFAIRYAKGWVLRERPALFIGRNPIWHVNVGMPAESFNDSVLRPRFQSVVAAALGLGGGSITESRARRSLDEATVGADAPPTADRGFAVIPESAAGMTGFAQSLRSAAGLYLLVDVGALTLDVSMFRLNRGAEGDRRYSFMAANVRPLGVESIEWFKTKREKTEDDCNRQCRRSLLDVIEHTKTKKDPAASVWHGESLPVLLTGGGAANKLHQEVVNWFDEGFRTSHYDTDGIRLVPLPAPRSIDWPEPLEGVAIGNAAERRFARLGVAWGLSNPPDDIGEIRPMREVGDVAPQAQRVAERFVSKDDV